MRKSKSDFWFWVWISEITLQKDSLKKRNPVGEVWENLLIVNASNEKDAYRKAVKYGKTLDGDSRGSLRLNGKPAITKFLGIQDMGLIHEEIQDGAEILFQSKRQTLAKAKENVQGRNVLSAVKKELAPLKKDRIPKTRKTDTTFTLRRH